MAYKDKQRTQEEPPSKNKTRKLWAFFLVSMWESTHKSFQTPIFSISFQFVRELTSQIWQEIMYYLAAIVKYLGHKPLLTQQIKIVFCCILPLWSLIVQTSLTADGIKGCWAKHKSLIPLHIGNSILFGWMISYV